MNENWPLKLRIEFSLSQVKHSLTKKQSAKVLNIKVALLQVLKYTRFVELLGPCSCWSKFILSAVQVTITCPTVGRFEFEMLNFDFEIYLLILLPGSQLFYIV